MARQRTGQLIERASGWYARVWTIIDGERVRVMRALGTRNKLVAQRKLEKLLAADNAATTDVRGAETFREAAERVYAAREADAGDRAHLQREELAQLRRHAFEAIGSMPAPAVQTTDINAVLDAAKAHGLAQHSVHHLRQRLSNVFDALRREGVIKVNPVRDSEMPKFAATVKKERAVLTDAELAVYLAWEPAKERHRASARERQTMACVCRMFGGLRTGDLHALRWEAFDVEQGGFEWGWAPRSKTKRPQLLEVPAMLRPMLHDHWERAGRPREGLLFPVRRPGKRGDRVGQQRLRVSHAAKFRRDLQIAFKAAAARNVEAPREGSRRWRELFDETDYTLQVDFHSWRRAYVQALADADVNAQQAAALAGHASLAAHALYLRNAGKLRRLPEAALPKLAITTGGSENVGQNTGRQSLAATGKQRAQAKGRTSETLADRTGQAAERVYWLPQKTLDFTQKIPLLTRRSRVRSPYGPP